MPSLDGGPQINGDLVDRIASIRVNDTLKGDNPKMVADLLKKYRTLRRPQLHARSARRAIRDLTADGRKARSQVQRFVHACLFNVLQKTGLVEPGSPMYMELLLKVSSKLACISSADLSCFFRSPPTVWSWRQLMKKTSLPISRCRQTRTARTARRPRSRFVQWDGGEGRWLTFARPFLG